MADWAEDHLRFSTEVDTYPSFELRRTPYMRPVFDWWNDDDVEEIMLIWPAQSGKSTLMQAAVAYAASCDPGPLIFVQADEVPTQAFIRDRLRKTLEQTCPELVPADQSTEWTDERGAWIGGLHLWPAWSTSESRCRSIPCRYVIGDETSLWRLPRSFVWERTKQFRLNRKALWGTTPTDPNEQSWYAATEVFRLHRWHVACPHCGKYQLLEWGRVKFEHCRRADESWDLDAVEDSTYYECQHCQKQITEAERGPMLQAGEARTDFPDRSKRRVSLRITALDVPGIPWGLTARTFLESQGSPDDLRTWTTSWMAQPWEPMLEGLRASKLLAREMDTQFAFCPQDTEILLAGVDVQKGKVYVVVRAWKMDGRSQLVYCAEVKDPKGRSTSRALEALWSEVLDRPWPVEKSTEQLRIAATAIDSGDGNVTERVYEFCYRHRGKVVPIKGVARGMLPVSYSTLDKYPNGKPIPGSLTLYRVSSAYYRDLIVGAYMAGLTDEGAYGVARGTPRWYGDHLESWQPTMKKRRDGSTIREFRQIRTADHGLDCFDPLTQVLTWGGWKAIATVTESDYIATVNLSTDKIEYQKPYAVISRPYEGPMVHLDGKRMDILVTPNHRMVCGRIANEEDKIKLASELTKWDRIKLTSGWDGIDISDIGINAENASGVFFDKYFDPGDFMELLGWFVSEGSRMRSKQNHANPNVHGVLLAQDSVANPKKCERIAALLDRLGWKYNYYGHQFRISSKPLYWALEECGPKCYNKRVPAIVKMASPDLIKRYLESAIMGDGNIQKGHRSYDTTSQLLADDMQELFIKAGYTANISMRQPPPCKLRGGSMNTRLQYHVSECKSPYGYLHRYDEDTKQSISIISSVPYSGMVYCASVLNGTLVCRRNGKAFIAGNCEIYTAALRDVSRGMRFARAQNDQRTPVQRRQEQTTQSGNRTINRRY